MTAMSPRDVALQDPLSELTRKERRSLLVASALGVVFVEGGFVPSKISTFGIEFSRADQRSLQIVVGIVVLYFLIGFIIYAASDFVKWRIAHVDAFGAAVKEGENRPRRSPIRIEDVEKDEDPWEELDQSMQDILVSNWRRAIDRNMPVIRLSMPISIARVLFEFVLPVVAAVYAIYVLWTGTGVLPSA